MFFEKIFSIIKIFFLLPTDSSYRGSTVCIYFVEQHNNITRNNNNNWFSYSGLDIVAIKQCVTLLVDLAKQGRTVVCTIHQPSSSLFHMFDHVYMLARGSCIYNGSPRQLVPFLSQIGQVCKPTHNPADFGTLLFRSTLLLRSKQNNQFRQHCRRNESLLV